jgi:hypothetical protein
METTRGSLKSHSSSGQTKGATIPPEAKHIGEIVSALSIEIRLAAVMFLTGIDMNLDVKTLVFFQLIQAVA